MRDPSADSSGECDDATSPVGGDATGTLLDTVGCGAYQLDREGRFVAVNDALTRLTGYDRETLLGSHVSRFLDAEDVVRAEAAVRDHLVAGSRDRIRLALPVVTSTGETIPCEVCISAVVREGEFRGTAGIVLEVEDSDAVDSIRDAGERRQAFDALAEASADGIIMLDDESTVRYVNPAVERILGHRPEDLTGRSLLNIVPDHLQRAHTEAFQRYLDTGEKHIDWTYVELPGRHEEGHEVPLAISFNEFEHDGKRYFVGTFRDISKRKEYEQELERKNERLDQFASMLAHELRSPLTVARTYLDFIDDADDATVDRIADALDRIDEIIEVLSVLARGRDTVGEREAVGLADGAAAAWATVETGEASLDVTATRILRANPTHLQQLLENLFRNAVEHGDGRITVRVGDLDGGFYVEDTGPGIPENEREAVVEAGYTTNAGGIGLGLTIVTRLADAYGWEYAITGSEEGGSRVEFTGVETATGA